MNRRTWVLGVLAALTGCATPPPVPLGGVAWSGRLALRIEGPQAQSMSARFELAGGAERGQFGMVTPLGTRVLQADWSPGGARLQLPDGLRQYASMDELTRDSLGEPVPVAALFDWLLGRPVVGVPHQVVAEGFTQSGWRIDTRQQAEGRFELSREMPQPRVVLRVVFDRS